MVVHRRKSAEESSSISLSILYVKMSASSCFISAIFDCFLVSKKSYFASLMYRWILFDTPILVISQFKRILIPITHCFPTTISRKLSDRARPNLKSERDMDAVAAIQDRLNFMMSLENTSSLAESAASVLTSAPTAAAVASSTPSVSSHAVATAAAVAGESVSSSPVMTQLARIFKSLAAVIVKQTTEVDIPDRRLGSFVTYLTSPFALLCMLMAVILNRTVVFASVRRPRTMPFFLRLLVRLVAIVQLTRAIGPLIVALKCYSTGLAPYIPEYFAVATPEECPKPDILWSLYKAFCTGHFVETFSSALQGRLPSRDTGMTLFEYSLAFQEAQSAQRPSVEVLVVSLLWAFNYLIFLIISVFDLQHYRLIPSTVFGMISLSYFGVSAVLNDRAQYFPTVWIIGFAPHLAVLCVIILCGTIYTLAALCSGGTANLHATVQTVNISLAEDFYSCLLKLGILVLTSAADVTYMAEGPALAVPARTWIEALEFQKRPGFESIDEPPETAESAAASSAAGSSLRRRIKFSASNLVSENSSSTIDSSAFGAQLIRRRRHSRSGRRRSSAGFAGGFLSSPLSSSTRASTSSSSAVGPSSGYASENTRVGNGLSGLDSAGGQRRKGADRFRWFVIAYRIRMAYILVVWTFRMCRDIVRRGVLNIRRKLFGYEIPETEENTNVNADRGFVNALIFGSFTEDEWYSALVNGAEFPEDDESGEFSPESNNDVEEEDDDYEDDDGDAEEDNEGKVVVASYASRSADLELFPELEGSDMSLATLLNPRDDDERHLADIMRAHLSANQIMTRNQMLNYQQYQQQQQQQIDDEGWYSDDSDSDIFEAENLAALINEIRSSKKQTSRAHSGFDDDDADDIRYQPSLCVVCQASQRSIVLWPCKCVAICEDCRASLAVRNFKGCVCCRRDVVSYSKLYVP
ncbi:hypothetical protein BZA70DRAFT_49971 [Myxozyma melibiosi]|uniref:Uncharacterized protein n=1 Tax=Myxozyma melibiosi TaxID=54550 RepID=A0ABR1FF78_9ASCO